MADKNLFTLDSLIKFSKERFAETTASSLTKGVYNQNQAQQKDTIMEYISRCAYGDENDKLFVKQLVRKNLVACDASGSQNFPAYYGVKRENIDRFIDWKSPILSSYLKFLAILLFYKHDQGMGAGALGHIIEKYHFNKLRDLGGGEMGFFIEAKDIDSVWAAEHIDMTYERKLEVITQVVYEESKGCSCIDELLYQDVGDISVGVSGVPDTVFSGTAIDVPAAYESCWIRYKGCSIHFRFTTFSSYEKLKEVCKLGVGYQMQGQFSEKDGFKLGYGKDGSRRSAAIEPFGESPALWVRKFTAKSATNEELFNGLDNCQKVMDVERIFVRGGVTIPVCGAQGSGKTTKLEALVEYVQPFYAIRATETEFEARLRWKYPTKNIFTIESNENSAVKPAEAYNFTLRTAGDIYVIGEARSDDMIVNVTRTANRGGRAVYFTFHPNSPAATIPEIANALIREKMYVNLKDAVATALDTVKVCVFVRMDLELGCRYYEIFEFVPRPNGLPTGFMDPTLHSPEIQRKFMETMYAYMQHMTSADVYYDTVPIVVYDRDAKSYVFKNTLSDRLYGDLMSNMPLQAEREDAARIFRPELLLDKHLREENIARGKLTEAQFHTFAQELGLNQDLIEFHRYVERKGE